MSILGNVSKTKTNSIAEAESKLHSEIAQIRTTTEEFLLNPKAKAPQFAIKATAGLGKTTQIIKELISASILKRGHVHYYVPNHRLSKELSADLANELDFPLTQFGDKGAIFTRSSIILGRNQKDKNNNTLCQKSELVASVVKAGLNVSESLCKKNEKACEFYDDCAYQKQFNDMAGWSIEGFPEELDNTVTIMVHANLFLPLDKRLEKPSLIVVDESFYNLGISKTEIDPHELFKGNYPISRAILEHLTDEKPNLLGKLRKLGFLESDLLAEAETVEAFNTSQFVELSPSLNINRQSPIVDNINTKKRSSLVLRAIAKEMGVVSRDACHSVSYHNDKIYIHERKELSLPEDVVTVFIDADIEGEILKQFRSNVHIADISAERLAVFHQVKDSTFSKYSLINKGGKSEALQADIKLFIRMISSSSLTLVVCSKSIRAALLGANKNAMDQESKLEGATIIHFGNLRGLNNYKDYRNIIIIGREQPPAISIEDSTRGLFWDSVEPISFLPFKGSGFKPLTNARRLFKLIGRTAEEVNVQVHPDKRTQLLLEQVREKESLQAIDRLRLLRTHENGERNVYVLSSVPLDLSIDNLFSWKGLQKLNRVLVEAAGLVPFNYQHLIIRCPSVKNRTSATRVVTELKSTNTLISIYIREMRLYFINYRETNVGKYSKALVSKDMSIEIRDNILSELLGTDDFEFKEEV